ncbi:ScbR family autoregulator-binding transcription factor [Streptomyces sp. NPDC088400]|uniref:ScbR family autoregulator-binding transcription factor n=1 Tax=Streptomyces sp. NPDC088400 TaxID=3365861 RepID=UPI00380948D7
MAIQKRAIRTRATILEAAGAVFDEYGYASTTLAMVLRRAQVTKGALYFHFPSKEALAQAVLDEQVQLGTVPPQACKLQEIVDISFVFGHRLLKSALLRGSVGLTVDQGAPPGVDHSGPFRQWPELMTSLLEQARDQGELLPSVRPRDTAELLVGSFTGIQLMSRGLTQRADLGRRISLMWEHILPSIAVPGLIPRMNIAPDRGARVTSAMPPVAEV